MSVLGNGLDDAEHHEDAMSVQEADLAMRRRLGVSEHNILVAQNNLAITYQNLRRNEEALQMRQDVYSGYLKLYGEHRNTLVAALNYAVTLDELERYAEAKGMVRKTIPVARRVLSENDMTTLNLRGIYAAMLHKDPASTLDDLRESVRTLEDLARTARRVLGGAHPLTMKIERDLRRSRTALRARETQPPRTFARGWLDGPD